MPPNNGGRGGKNNGKKPDPLLESLRDACPPHKKSDLDKLYKQMNGDEVKIREKIQLWWNEPVEQEEVWEDVTKKAAKKLEKERDAARAGRGRGPGRGGRGRGERGGRGPGERGRGEGRAAGSKKDTKEETKQENVENNEKPELAPAAVPQAPTMPAAVSKAPELKGAWGSRAAPAPQTSASVPAPIALAEPVKKPPVIMEEPTPVPASNPLDIGVTVQSSPMPSGIVKATPVAPGVNVWATKGSAHLIRAEKPKPPPAPVAPPAPAAPPAPVAPMVPAPIVVAEPAVSQIVPEAALKGGLSTGAWGKPVPMADPMPVAPVPAPVPVQVSPQKSAPPPPSPVVPSNVLNMGHWDSGDAGDSQQLDFGFGSFGADVDASQVAASPAGPNETNPAALSPARPPPGLSLGGMPAMPEGAVMVSDLENKMESASMTAQKNDESTSMASSLPHSVPTLSAPALGMPGGPPVQQNYNQYGMPGMYNYNAAAGGGFVGMTPAGPVLTGGGVPGQPGKPEGSLSAGGALYGSQPAAVPMSGVGPESSIDNVTGNGPASGAGIPPGMPGAIPYGNPALAHYGQHQFYMGQAQGGIGYNYGYGQFGGVAQGGFGYQQVMGQNQGYGAPHYDEHSQQNAHQAGASGGYHKNTGGYRGRNNHHNNHHYQTNTIPSSEGMVASLMPWDIKPISSTNGVVKAQVVWLVRMVCNSKVMEVVSKRMTTKRARKEEVVVASNKVLHKVLACKNRHLNPTLQTVVGRITKVAAGVLVHLVGNKEAINYELSYRRARL